MRHKGKFLLPVLAAGVLGATLLPAGMAAADTIGNSLPITSFSQLAVDSLHQHLFFRQTDSIVVTDFTGKQVTAISGLSSLDYIVVSPDSSTLYALGSDGSVHVYSTATLTQTTTYALPAGDVPSALAVQSGKLWVSYNDNNVTGTSDIGALGYFDLTASATSPVFTGDALPGTWYRAPEITADPSNSGVLLAYTGEQSAQVITYDTVNDQVIAQQRILVTDGSNISDASMLPGGRQFILSLIQGNAVLYNSSDLSQAATYANTNPFPESLAVAPTGAVAVGQLLSEDPNELDPDVAVFQPGITNSVFNTYNAAGSLALAVAPHGLAWSADGSRLFTVEGSSGSTADYRLDVLDDPSKIHSTLTLTGPSRVIVGPDATATLTGRLTLSNNAAMPSDAAVTVTRTAPDGTVSSLPAPAIGSDGSFSATDAGPITGTGTYTYTVSYTDASGAITPSTSSFAVSAEKYGAVLQLHGPASTALTYGQGVSFTGNLSLGDNGNADSGNKTITITRSGTSAKTFTATTASDGSFTFSDPPLPIGHYTYTASYAGDASTNAATAAITVSVAQRQPTLTIGANVAKAAYGQKITVTATLGPTFADRSVSLYATPYGQKQVLVKTGKVTAAGQISITYVMTRTTTFTAWFQGDEHNAAIAVQKAIGSEVKVWMGNSGWYTNVNLGGTLYHQFHSNAHLNANVIVTPNKAGRKAIRFEIQQYENGLGWFANSTVGTFTLNSKSSLSTYLTLADAVGPHFRIRAVYVEPSTDKSNLTTQGAWMYFKVVK